MIPVSTVRLGEEEEELVLRVLRSGQLAQGSLVAQLESRFADAHNVKHAVAVNNGTTALTAALEVLGVGKGDEVITSPFTFVATLNAILGTGATVRFAEIGPDFNVDAASLAAVVSHKTKVLLPVHLYGLPVDMGPVAALAEHHNLAIVEDAAQAVLATCDGHPVGSYGLGCFSLYATKNFTTGEGGIVTTNDDALADKLRILRNQGMRVRYQYEMAGNNYRLTDLAAAIGIPQLDRLGQLTLQRANNARKLSEGLSGIPGLIVPSDAPTGRTHVWHQYTVRVTDEASIDGRDALSAGLADCGVGSGVYYPKLVHDYDCYRQNSAVIVDHTPYAARVASEVLSLPVHPYLTPDEIGTIVASVRSVMGAR